jgi:histidine triad (HIT) family protein
MCLFCKILRGEEEGYILYRDDFFTAFLDKFPVTPGHTLIATNNHFDNILEVDDETLERVGKVVKLLGRAIKNALKADGIRVLTNVGRSSGQVIFHTHIHIIPSWEDDHRGNREGA